MRELNVALAQLNPKVGDIAGNLSKILTTRQTNSNVDLIVFSECVLTGYPVEDLVQRPAFMKAVMAGIEELRTAVAETDGPEIIFGTPYIEGGKVYNAAIYVARNGKVQVRFKSELPNYDVFDEVRNFARAIPADNQTFRVGDYHVGMMICEDGWFPRVAESLYKGGADIIFWINGSPFCQGKDQLRKEVTAQRAKECHGTPILYVNQVGVQDDIVFDGAGFVSDREGNIVAQLPAFEESVTKFKLVQRTKDIEVTIDPNVRSQPYPCEEESIYRALMLSLRDYVEKNRFPYVVLGLSGGIDSGLVAAIAADALGPDRVWAIRLPSQWTSDESNDLATEQCRRMGIRCDTIAIAEAVAVLENNVNTLALSDLPFPSRDPKGLAEENGQSRERGQTLMWLSNKFGPMVVSTGNKSEYSTGYATLYGDMCGGYALLKDVWKLDVFAVAKWRNDNQPIGSRLPRGPKQTLEVIPARVIERPPTAELKPGQSDEESLMPYEFLDPLLIAMVEDEKSNDDTALMLLERFGAMRNWCDDVDKMRRLLDLAEYKRRQAAPGPKITRKSYGKGRRYPITNGFVEVCSVEVRAMVESKMTT